MAAVEAIDWEDRQVLVGQNERRMPGVPPNGAHIDLSALDRCERLCYTIIFRCVVVLSSPRTPRSHSARSM